QRTLIVVTGDNARVPHHGTRRVRITRVAAQAPPAAKAKIERGRRWPAATRRGTGRRRSLLVARGRQRRGRRNGRSRAARCPLPPAAGGRHRMEAVRRVRGCVAILAAPGAAGPAASSAGAIGSRTATALHSGAGYLTALRPP